MPPAKTVYVPRFGSQQDSGQKHEPQPDQTGSSSRGQTGSSSRGQTGSSSRGQTGSSSRGQTGSSSRGQTGSSSRGQTGSSSRGQEDKSGNKRANDGREKTPGLKVKLPKLNRGSLLAKVKEIKTPTKWMLDRAANKSETAVNLGAETRCADTGSALADGDVFFFSQRCNTKATKEKEKTRVLCRYETIKLFYRPPLSSPWDVSCTGQAKLSVLRTISKMLEENQLIRQRLAALSQAG